MSDWDRWGRFRSEPKKGQMMPVRVVTHVAGSLQFASGPVVQIMLSFDVHKHQHTPIELYGTEAAMLVPDPNMFGGEVKVAGRRAEFRQCRGTVPERVGVVRRERQRILDGGNRAVDVLPMEGGTRRLEVRRMPVIGRSDQHRIYFLHREQLPVIRESLRARRLRRERSALHRHPRRIGPVGVQPR